MLGTVRFARFILKTYLIQLFSVLDALAKSHKIERLKTLGDAYVAVANVTEPHEHHAEVSLRENNC